MNMKKIKNKGLIIIILYFLILIIANVYFRIEYDKIRNEYQALIITTNQDPSNLINNAEGIVSQKRLLSFQPGKDNEIIYYPKIILNPDGSQSYENVDKNKLLWLDLLTDNDIIYAQSASDCNTSLSKNEVIIQLDWVDDSSFKITNAINKEIVFKHNETLISLKIKEINETDIYKHICIGDELYNELLSQEDKFVYEFRFDNYKNYQKTASNLSLIQPEKKLTLAFPSKEHNTSNKENNHGNMIDFLQILNIISIIILAILITYAIIHLLIRKINKEN